LLRSLSGYHSQINKAHQPGWINRIESDKASEPKCCVAVDSGDVVRQPGSPE